MNEPAGGTHRLFIDQVEIHVRGGHGGAGCVSFRREKYVPKGGPDGGDGGHGGSVYLVARSGVDTLLDLSGRHHYHAADGRPGEGSNCTGRSGEDLEVVVPIGTLVYDEDAVVLLKDMIVPDQRICVAPGGRGGFGNRHYVSSVNQEPRTAQPGLPGVERTLRLELKLIADVGLVGLPNAGKSTLLSRWTNARPRIAGYPFTTQTPQLGIAELTHDRRIVIADIPGLIEGAHEGAGMGDAFLRHIERTRVLVHLIDLCPPEGSPTPDEAYQVIRSELQKYSPALARREEIVVGTKLDLTDAELSLDMLQESLGLPVMGISGVTGRGLRPLLERVWERVQTARERTREQERQPQRMALGDEIDADPRGARADAGAADAEVSPFEWNPQPEQPT